MDALQEAQIAAKLLRQVPQNDFAIANGELVALTANEIKFNPDTGDGVAIIRMTKVNREEARYLVPEAVEPLQTWLSHAGISTGAIFRRFESTGAVGHRSIHPSIHPQEVARIIQRVDRLLNAQHTGTEPVWPIERLAAHSTRIGATHDLAANGIDLTSIMHSGGWTDPKMPRYYTRELTVRESGLARMMRARKDTTKV
jgi:hypothetical protein